MSPVLQRFPALPTGWFSSTIPQWWQWLIHLWSSPTEDLHDQQVTEGTVKSPSTSSMTDSPPTEDILGWDASPDEQWGKARLVDQDESDEDVELESIGYVNLPSSDEDSDYHGYSGLPDKCLTGIADTNLDDYSGKLFVPTT